MSCPKAGPSSAGVVQGEQKTKRTASDDKSKGDESGYVDYDFELEKELSQEGAEDAMGEKEDTEKALEKDFEEDVHELEKTLEDDEAMEANGPQDGGQGASRKRAADQKGDNSCDDVLVVNFEGDANIFGQENLSSIVDDSAIEEAETDNPNRVRHSTFISNTNGEEPRSLLLSSSTLPAEDDIVELSGDEEDVNPDDDVTLVCMKRPAPIISLPSEDIECVEILDSDEEFPVCVKPAEKVDTVTVEEKKGYVKEYIETEGLGVLHSDEHGLVLFHLSNVWINGEQLEKREAKTRIPVGSNVLYYEKAFEGPDYKVLCEAEVICQAVAVWTGERPKHLLKQIDEFGEEDWARLEEHRRTFLLYIRGEVFTPAAFVRLRGRVHGYLNGELGLIEVMDENNKEQNVFFHVNDVRIYRKTIREHRTFLHQALPVGLHVFVDARRCHVFQGCEIKYQAIAVFAGTWPKVPYPTLLPGGPGSYAPKHEIPDGTHTFYYLELQLESLQQKKVAQLKSFLEANQENLRFEWRGVATINSKIDVEQWKATWDPYYHQKQQRSNNRPRRDPHEKIHTTHTFKAPLIRHFKTKEEFDPGSLVCQPGSTQGSMSERSFGSMNVSRTSSRLSQYSDQSWQSDDSKVRTPSLAGSLPGRISNLGLTRTWYNPSMFSMGGLRLKTEIKDEPVMPDEISNGTDFSQPPLAKRIKME